jgi:hypothetical protein
VKWVSDSAFFRGWIWLADGIARLGNIVALTEVSALTTAQEELSRPSTLTDSVIAG